MPRLSVDIDLQYIYIDDRKTAFTNINNAIHRIVNNLNYVQIDAEIQKGANDICKIICSNEITSIKIEPNYVIRGCITPPEFMQNSLKVQETYGFATINVLSFGELFGGKICAALDRQHPRDLFDVKYLLNHEGVISNVKNGFLVYLLSHNHPPHEILKPNIQDRELIFAKEFVGMCEENFHYEDHLEVLQILINKINEAFTERDKEFLISFFSCTPKWELINIKKTNELPAIKWKMQNLKLLKTNNKQKFIHQLSGLDRIFSM